MRKHLLTSLTLAAAATLAAHAQISPSTSLMGMGGVANDVQQNPLNWRSWGQLAPTYQDCSQCSGLDWTLNFHVAAPSLSGDALEVILHPHEPWADMLASIGIIGQNSPQLPDSSHTILPKLSHFVYDTDVFVTNVHTTQALEFDINLFQNGVSMIWGHQCAPLGDQQWDIWDNVRGVWVATGVPCHLQQGWNHVTVMAEKAPNNTLLYQSVTLNGYTTQLNRLYPAGTVDPGWYGLTVNYQVDADKNQDMNITYIDNLHVAYW